MHMGMDLERAIKNSKRVCSVDSILLIALGDFSSGGYLLADSWRLLDAFPLRRTEL